MINLQHLNEVFRHVSIENLLVRITQFYPNDFLKADFFIPTLKWPFKGQPTQLQRLNII